MRFVDVVREVAQPPANAVAGADESGSETKLTTGETLLRRCGKWTSARPSPRTLSGLAAARFDGPTSWRSSYVLSQSRLPLIDKAFRWMKQTGGIRKTKLRGLAKVAWQFQMTAADSICGGSRSHRRHNCSGAPENGVFNSAGQCRAAIPLNKEH